MVKHFFNFIVVAFITTSFSLAHAASSFTIKQIQLEGNQRVSFETVRSYLTIEVGDTATELTIQQSIKALYKTGFFRDIALFEADNGVLKIRVLERPSISEVEMEGNELITKEEMTMVLSGLGVKQGRIFNDTRMESIILDLRRRYQNQGYYAAEVDIQVTELPRNRVALLIKVEEGNPATIGRITLVGNKTYLDDTLKGHMLLTEEVIFGDSDKYAKPKLESDIESLRSYYMDRGFAEYAFSSSQVSLSLDKTEVFITINMNEGPQYTFGSINFSGDPILEKAELDSLLAIQVGDYFSRSQIVQTVNALRNRLSEEGYAFAEIEPLTELDKNNRLVNVDFRIEPKSRVYVRRIRIEGNTRTWDNVIRRELRQLESAPYSLEAVRQSNLRLNKLGYFKSARVSTERISKDLVDLVVQVEEQSTGSFNAGVGYSQIDGISFTLGVTERNVIGSGYSTNISARSSASTKYADISLTDPYFTQNGISLTGAFYYRQIDAAQLNVSDYTTNNLGVRTSVSYPLDEWSKINSGIKLDRQSLECVSTFILCNNYVDQNNQQGHESVRLTLGWQKNTTNSYSFSTDGRNFTLSGELVIPTNSDISFYKLYYHDSAYFPLNEIFTFKLKGDMAYAGTYAGTSEIPFYENFYAGGFGTVRGYEANSLGDRFDLTTDGSSRPIGGTTRLVSNAEVIFPMPFVEDSSNIRLSLFVDAGSVFNQGSNIRLPELRSATGLALSWLTPIGPLAFSLAKPLNYQDGDKTQVFQFNLGIPM